MAWTVELSSLAQKNLEQLAPQIARRILTFLYGRVAVLDDPRGIGEALTAPGWAGSGSIALANIELSAASRTVHCASSS